MINATDSMDPTDSESDKTSEYEVILSITFLGIIVIISIISVIGARLGWSWCREDTHDHDRNESESSDMEQDSVTAVENRINVATLDENYPKFLCSEAHEVAYADKVGVSILASSCCSICLGEYKEADMIRLLPGCGHLFHQNCIDPWLMIHSTCPVCRSCSVTNTPQQIV